MNLIIHKIIDSFIKLRFYLFSTSNKRSFWFSTYNGRLLVFLFQKYFRFKRNSRFEFDGFIGNQTIEQSTGFLCKINVNYDVNKIVQLCNNICDSHQKNENVDGTKNYLREINILNHNAEMREFIKFGLSKELINPVSNYFGEIPIIHEIRIFRSENKFFVGGSQLFHCDKEADQAFKVFLTISDNDNRIPNQCVIDAKSTKMILKKYGKNKLYHRISDEFVEKNISKDKYNYIYGRSGDIWGIDVCRCLHYGSRPSKKSRTLLWLLYLPKRHYKFPYKLQGYEKMDLVRFVDWNLSETDRYILTGN